MSKVLDWVGTSAVKTIADFKVFEELALKNKGNRANADAKSLEVIGAGFSRTATMAMYAALIELGYHCCHGSELQYPTGLNAAKWQPVVERDLRNGNTEGVDWAELVKGYTAGTDLPFADYWLELSKTFPDSKIVYTYRDGDTWMQSFRTAILDPMTHSLLFRWGVVWFPPTAKVLKVVHLVQRKYMRDFGGTYENGGIRPELIQERLKAIQKEIPPERLLVFHPKEGWEPLCTFLGKPIPDKPFPKINDGPSMAWVLRSIAIVGMSLWAAAFALTIGLARWLYFVMY